jgi:SAM-dependent methyltransferase
LSAGGLAFAGPNGAVCPRHRSQELIVPEACPTCVICNNDRSAVDAETTSYLNLPEPFAVVACRDCGFRWLNPRPTAAEYTALYSDGYFAKAADNNTPETPWLRNFPPVEEDYSTAIVNRLTSHFRSRLRLLERLCPRKGSILDVGAATGDFVVLAREAGFETVGLEPSPAACHMAREKHGVSLTCGDLFSYDAGNKRFDVVHLNHVFEHLLDPAAALDRIRRLMHPDSLLVIEVPNQFENWPQKVRQIMNRIERLPRSLHSIHHTYFYTRTHLERLLSDHGFRVLRSKTFSLGRRLHIRPRPHNFVLGLIGWIGNLIGGYGEDIEVVATLDP